MFTALVESGVQRACADFREELEESATAFTAQCAFRVAEAERLQEISEASVLEEKERCEVRVAEEKSEKLELLAKNSELEARLVAALRRANLAEDALAKVRVRRQDTRAVGVHACPHVKEVNVEA